MTLLEATSKINMARQHINEESKAKINLAKQPRINDEIPSKKKKYSKMLKNIQSSMSHLEAKINLVKRKNFSKINSRRGGRPKGSKNISKWCVTRRNDLRIVIARNKQRRKRPQNSTGNDESWYENSGNEFDDCSFNKSEFEFPNTEAENILGDEFDSPFKSENYFEFSDSFGGAASESISQLNENEKIVEDWLKNARKVTVEFPKKLVKKRMNYDQDQNIFENCYYSYFANSSIVSEKVINFDHY